MVWGGILAALAALVSGGPSSAVVRLTPREKAALVVVSGLPAPRGVAGVIYRAGDSRPPEGALVFVDQEGGAVRTFPHLAPAKSAAAFATVPEALAAGRATGRGLRAAGAHVDLAPVLDLPDGPLGSRHFRSPSIGVAFARGLLATGVAACAKHFPGLGSAAISTDERVHVDARVRARDLAAFRAAVRAGVPCVMTSNAFYDGAPFRATTWAPTYRLLRSLGFEGVAVTDSLSIVRAAPVERWARRAVGGGADLLLFTSPRHARRAIAALVPLARSGALDAHVARVLRFRAAYLR